MKLERDSIPKSVESPSMNMMHRRVLVSCFVTLLVCLVFGISSCHNTSKSVDNLSVSDSLDSIKYLEQIQKFYTYKHYFLTSTLHPEIEKLYSDSLHDAWSTIQKNKKEYIRFLFCFSESESYLLYGDEYMESKLRVQPIKDKYHALYLIEAIQRNDYLFNRRHRNSLHRRYFFANDGINVLYSDKDCPDTIGLFDTIYFHNSQTYNRRGWKIVTDYFENELNFEKSGPIITESDLAWFSITKAVYGTDSSEYFNSMVNDSLFRKKYFFDFMCFD